MRNKLTIGAFLLMLIAFIVVLALPADEESIKSENRVMSTIPPVKQGLKVLSGIISLIVHNLPIFQKHWTKKEDLYRRQVKLFPQIKI